MLKIKKLTLSAVFVLLMLGLSAQYTGQVNFTLADVNTKKIMKLFGIFAPIS